MCFIAVDLGATFIKGAVIDTQKLCLTDITKVSFPGFIEGLPSSFREVEPARIVLAVKTLVSDLLRKSPDCEGLVMCSQMHGLVLTDENGIAISNFISWQDGRTLLSHPNGHGSYFDVICSRISDRANQISGSELKPGLPVCTLFWLSENDQLKPNAIPVSLADFVLSCLCGTTPVTDLTNASACGAVDLKTMDWNHEILSNLGLADLQWPEIVEHGRIVGNLEVDGRCITCYTPVGDQQCALLGCFLQDGELSLNISTGSQVSMVLPELGFGDYQVRPFFDGFFIKTITHIPAGRSLNILLKLLCELPRLQNVKIEDPWPYIIAAVDQIKKTDLKIDLSVFQGVYKTKGCIANIREDNLSVGHLFCAAFHHMSENYYSCALRLSRKSKWNRIVFSGGIARKIEILRKIIVKNFNHVDYRLCDVIDETLVGLSALAFFFSGRTNSIKEGANFVRSNFQLQ